MGSYERYVVHAAVQDISGVETASQGEGPERHVQIVSKKKIWPRVKENREEDQVVLDYLNSNRRSFDRLG